MKKLGGESQLSIKFLGEKYSQNNVFETISCVDLPLPFDEKKHSASSAMA